MKAMSCEVDGRIRSGVSVVIWLRCQEGTVVRAQFRDKLVEILFKPGEAGGRGQAVLVHVEAAGAFDLKCVHMAVRPAVGRRDAAAGLARVCSRVGAGSINTA